MNWKAVSILALLLSGSAVFAQQPATGTTAGDGSLADLAQKSHMYLEILENFEEAEDWRAKSTCPIGETKLLKMVQRGEIVQIDDENTTPSEGEAYSVEQSPDNPNHIMGVKTFFDNRGFDRVEISPPHELVIKGKARQFSVWVLGRKFRHNMSVKIRDYRGKIHTLPLGRLDFFGWRKLTVTVPGWLPQSSRYSMLDKNLHFVSLFVTSDVHEVPGEFYFYVDGLKVMVDKSEQAYPGTEIKDNW
jgi:hypothetical protein